MLAVSGPRSSTPLPSFADLDRALNAARGWPAVDRASQDQSAGHNGRRSTATPPARAARGAVGARRAPLVLTEGHLRYEKGEGLASARLSGRFDTPDLWSVRIQDLGKGGHETTIRRIPSLSEEAVINAIQYGRPPRVRAERGESEHRAENAKKAAWRAKRKVRQIAKWITADRLLTFTTRNKLRTLDDARQAWDRVWRLLRRAVPGLDVQYVATVERHKSGFLHIHAAMNGHFPLKIAHRCWQIANGGTGAEKGAHALGTIDLDKRTRGRKRPPERIARYISKYLVKDFEDDSRLNAKRYWASRADLPAVRRCYLRSSDQSGAWQVFARFMGFSFEEQRELMEGRRLFAADDGKTIWYEWPGGLSPPCALDHVPNLSAADLLAFLVSHAK